MNRAAYADAIVKGAALYCDLGIQRMTQLNLLHENALWAQASEELYTQWMKVYVEGYHLDPSTSGYEWWLGFDWWGLSNGLIGGHENEPRSKPGICNETLRSVQREIMLLTPSPLLLQTAAWAPGQDVFMPLLLQNLTFGGFPSWAGGASLMWTATTLSDGDVVATAHKKVTAGAVTQGETGWLANISFTMPEAITAYETVRVWAELRLGEGVVEDGSVWATSWDLGVFQAAPHATVCKVPVLASSQMLALARLHCSNAALMPSANYLPRTPFVVIAGQEGLSAVVATALDAVGGAAVLLSPPPGSLPASMGLHPVGLAANVDAFHQPWWSSPGSTCAMVYNSSLVRGSMKLRGSFVPFPFGELITNATAYVLDNVSALVLRGVQVHVRSVPVDATDKTTCNGGNGCGAQLTTISNQALVMEAPLVRAEAAVSAIGRGAMAVVCGLDILNVSMLPKSPSAWWVFAALVDDALRRATVVEQV